MISRDALLAISTVLGYFSLPVGTLGLAGTLGAALRPYLPLWILVPIALVPWLLIYTITFFNRPFLSPRQYRICLVFAMGWFALFTVLAEVLYHCGLWPPPDGPQKATTLPRLFMHAGWLSLLFVIPQYFAARRAESQVHGKEAA
ncbi:hypothetical protein AYO49_05235 [Verrucomicrobiaceae bacterium SCGC AG-212-N21]|nr:hypothetical protein AYO49_05235 [Verrucomicrobiaceae bacterium SCGC AG-212-N21]